MAQEELVVKFKKLHEDAVLPSYAREDDGAMDLIATSVEDLRDSKGYIEYGTGLAIEIPVGYRGLIHPRSSISNVSLVLCNSVGLIDAGYRGEIKVRFREVFRKINRSIKGAHAIYEPGHKVAQLMIERSPLIEPVWSEDNELSESERGEGGFGSTSTEE